MENKTSGKLASKHLECICLPKDNTKVVVKVPKVSFNSAEVPFTHLLDSCSTAFVGFVKDVNPVLDKIFLQHPDYLDTLRFVFGCAKHHIDICTSHHALIEAVGDALKNGGQGELSTTTEDDVDTDFNI